MKCFFVQFFNSTSIYTVGILFTNRAIPSTVVSLLGLFFASAYTSLSCSFLCPDLLCRPGYLQLPNFNRYG
ncbi:hypothetical protein BDV27DRAFT_89471 [Aspergillus caelatus]|uniref:Uncharacterized protein n=1 Tax=Aspergillus caelatus TaxID=61420 RepID=A0A5N6ZM95_9EURO|nr:uncharacterized protein BDV27DRAFT_89471 [Aspergillus caelatus]KAE8357300.1 hypothetical protein BDV27DRAFT_89471 [Aspergillus caelatus]